MIQFDQYFSNGLKPPTSEIYEILYLCGVCLKPPRWTQWENHHHISSLLGPFVNLHGSHCEPMFRPKCYLCTKASVFYESTPAAVWKMLLRVWRQKIRWLLRGSVSILRSNCNVNVYGVDHMMLAIWWSGIASALAVMQRQVSRRRACTARWQETWRVRTSFVTTRALSRCWKHIQSSSWIRDGIQQKSGFAFIGYTFTWQILGFIVPYTLNSPLKFDGVLFM